KNYENYRANKRERAAKAKKNIRNPVVQFSSGILGAGKNFELRESLVAPHRPAIYRPCHWFGPIKQCSTQQSDVCVEDELLKVIPVGHRICCTFRPVLSAAAS